jgi:hypothetical protein
MRNRLVAALVVGLVATSAMGAEEWETVATGAVSIRVRMRPDIPGGREVWAEGSMDAGLAYVRAALRDHAQFRLWMPYVKESRVLKEDAPGSRVTYTRLAFPIISNRDYVLHVEEEEGHAEDGSVTFTQKWTPDNGVAPEREGIVRLHHNSGSWFFTPRGETQVRYVYRFTVEPGGSIPGFLAGVGQKDAVLDTVRAVEKRARELAVRGAAAP